jgi:hypothetical protein
MAKIVLRSSRIKTLGYPKALFESGKSQTDRYALVVGRKYIAQKLQLLVSLESISLGYMRCDQQAARIRTQPEKEFWQIEVDSVGRRELSSPVIASYLIAPAL